MLTLTVLGSGTSIPSPRRAPAHLVQAGETTVLLDCGSGCETGLFLAGVTLDRLDAVLLTHLHPDHTAGLLPLLFALVNPLHPRRGRELPIRGPEGTAAHLAALEVAHGRYVRPSCGVSTEELTPPRRIDIGPLRVSAFAVDHSAASLAFRLEHGGAVLCYSGDSGPCDTLVEAARGADLFLCECAALEGEAQQGHLTPSQVGAIARAAGCARVVLTHLYPHVERADPLPGVRGEFPGPVELAGDGRRFEVRTKTGRRG